MRRPALLVGAALVAASASAAPVAPRLPGPAGDAYGRGKRAEDDASCVKCHATVGEEHATSLHRAAFTDSSFQRGYTDERSAFCRSCHAPEGKPADEPDAFARDHGVACVTCHRPMPSGAILTGEANERGDRSVSSAPHPVVRVAGFGTRACASCHEFAFPGAEKNGAKGLMQKTLSEHAASKERDRSCVSCHMPKNGRGQSSHRFVASRDRDLLARSLDVSVLREGDRALFTLTTNGVGHAFPTGDLFRRLVLRVRSSAGTIEQPLGRSFGATRDATGRSVRFEASDLRVAERRRIYMPLPSGAVAATWEVAYQRVTSFGELPPFGATVEAELVLAGGTILSETK